MNEQVLYQQALQILRDHGYKLTEARKQVLDILMSHAEHLTSSDILALTVKSDANIGRASVFRALDLFTDLGIIRPIYHESQSPHYVVFESNGHHAHLVCRECDKVVDLDECHLGELLDGFAAEHKFSLSGHLLELFGVCEDCSLHK
ncbi:MAG TPA: transcriptional repressor [Chloroflexi bacterium]|nr:transcriptional repressor [Chloroflexota bacterium]